jgi:hypothetical protein
MMRAASGLANEVIEKILELSADAQIARRRTAEDSSAFHTLTGTIVAYGKALGLLIAIREREEFYAILEELELPASVSEQVN